jgi:hypothetical protein
LISMIQSDRGSLNLKLHTVTHDTNILIMAVQSL